MQTQKHFACSDALHLARRGKPAEDQTSQPDAPLHLRENDHTTGLQPFRASLALAIDTAANEAAFSFFAKAGFADGVASPTFDEPGEILLKASSNHLHGEIQIISKQSIKRGETQ